MHRLAVSLSAFALIFVMMVNIALFVQNNKLRTQTSAAPPQPTQATARQAAPEQIEQLEQQLARSEQDRIKATRDATSARNQLTQLQSAAQERDTFKSQVQSLQQENQELKAEVGNLQTMNTINGQVVPLRGLTPLKNVPRDFMNHQQLREYFTAALDRAWSPAAEQQQRAVMQALDMDAGGSDMRQAQIDSMVKSILGFYDHTSQQLVIVTDRAKMGVRDRVTYAHEFTHSLQDQHYDLTALFARAGGNSDHQMALKGLVEGDATLTMGLYARENLTAMDIADYQLEEFQSIDLSGALTGGGGPLTESATYFPYQEGAAFVAQLYQSGGWGAVDAAFENPPRSTEQVLHPERYFSGDAPTRLQLPTLDLNGWHRIAENTLGELYLRIYLEHRLDFAQAIPAAEGWGGDRYQVLGDDQGRLALALHSAWDRPADAREFFDVYSAFVVALAGGLGVVVVGVGCVLGWVVAGRQFYLSLAGAQVLALHAPDAATLDALIGQFKGF
jgi:hypothetical protein